MDREGLKERGLSNRTILGRGESVWREPTRGEAYLGKDLNHLKKESGKKVSGIRKSVNT